MILVLVISTLVWIATILLFFFPMDEKSRWIGGIASLVSAGLVRLVGREEITAARKLGGHIKLSTLQAILVTSMLIALGISFPWLMGLLATQK